MLQVKVLKNGVKYTHEDYYDAPWALAPGLKLSIGHNKLRRRLSNYVFVIFERYFAIIGVIL